MDGAALGVDRHDDYMIRWHWHGTISSFIILEPGVIIFRGRFDDDHSRHLFLLRMCFNQNDGRSLSMSKIITANILSLD